MPRSDELLATASKVLLKNYRQAPVVFAKGLGAQLWDVDGKRYLDMTAGIAVCALGHSHPTFVARVSEQLGRITQVSNLYYTDSQILAAEALVKRSFGNRVFFCNSGAEANEAALKLARRYQALVAGHPERTTVVAALGSFHGRSIATISVTGQAKYREDFGPLFGPVEFVPYGDLAAARAVLESRQACAIIVEPIQGEGGVIVPPADYLPGLRKLCDETGTLLIFDEVQTGVGRTGRWFGYQWEGVNPDVMTLAKGLGGGLAIGALVCSEAAAPGLAPSSSGVVAHASTFGGNPLACAAARAVIEIIEKENLLQRVIQNGEVLGAGLAKLVERDPTRALEARGRGLLRGLKVARPPAAIVAACRERGVLLSIVGSDVIRFAPPLVISPAQIEEALSVLGAVLQTS